jgi:hypothetical protein
MYNHAILPERYDPEISAIYALNDIDIRPKWSGSCSSMLRTGRVIFAED